MLFAPCFFHVFVFYSFLAFKSPKAVQTQMSGSAGNKRSKRDDGTAKRNLGQETAAATAAAAAGGSGASEQASKHANMMVLFRSHFVLQYCPSPGRL